MTTTGVATKALNALNGTSSSATSSSASSTSASDLESTFLQLLVAQMQNQDPTSPMDSSQMVSQLAQINTVSGISQLNTSLTSLASQLTASQQQQNTQLIGQNVLVQGNSATVSGGKSSGFGLALSSAASNVTVTITNSSGAVVDTMNLGAQSAGIIPVSWTPTDSSGNTLPDGTYTVSAVATSSGGTQSDPTTLSSEMVTGMVPNSSYLLLQNGSAVDTSSIAAIL
ncbi:MAG TPA: flagellar hook assembly protein FlgD [Trinickia sp.]|jgi:flagellar basal-body rod modification protein FlgD|uniref:flagellar hook assembly protein FlgD n=1 Tax=Trinickia sp. TaxID=2571163 RepID=UPI002CBBBC23|nr:flagellar hook assembly protein FlgD [Trinickia sp.]HTI17084.1 flagellar hook assembly protein FlgD [Trinickia sp.]